MMGQYDVLKTPHICFTLFKNISITFDTAHFIGDSLKKITISIHLT